MKKYVLHRFLQLIPILLGITFLSFAMMRMAGSDVVTEMYQNRGTEVSQEIIDAKRAELGLDQPFLIQYGRWLGGMLTNFETIKKRVQRLAQLRKMEEDGTFELLPKKEVTKLSLEIEKLEKYLGGIKNMKKLPSALFIVDPRKEPRQENSVFRL